MSFLIESTRFIPALLALLVLGSVVRAQDDTIKVKFEVDGKEVHQPFKVFLSADGGAVFEPPIPNSSFIFPPELCNSEKVALRFEAGEFVLDYGWVHRSKFEGAMTFGVDLEPFDEENIPSQRPQGKEITSICYIEFADWTRLTVVSYK